MTLRWQLAVIGLGVACAGSIVLTQGQVGLTPVAVDCDDIGGVVSGPDGPEAGVWVIAETDDQGRYLLPDLPDATYRVWVRGYGLVDSPPVEGEPGDHLMLTAVPAPDARAATQYYPANYWYSLLEVPPASEFPGTGPDGNGIDRRW